MKISCTPISLARAFKEDGMNLEGYINYMGEINIDGVDILDSRGYSWQWKDFKNEIKQLPEWMAKAGLKIAAYACGNNFTQKDDTEFKNQVEVVKNAVEEASEVGAPLLRIFGGKHPFCGGELPHHKALERVIQGIEQCLPVAENKKIILAIENHGCLPGHSYEIENLINHFDSPYFKCMFDCANFIANNMDETEDPLRACERLQKYIVHVHFKDFKLAPPDSERRVNACVAGQGIVPLRQVAALLEKNAYGGYFSLEYEAGAFVPEKEGVKQSLDYANEIKAVNRLFE